MISVNDVVIVLLFSYILYICMNIDSETSRELMDTVKHLDGDAIKGKWNFD